MNRTDAKILYHIYEKLRNHFGHQNWWPGDTRFEVIIGAILTQNTNWGNVEKAINNLKKQALFSPAGIIELKNDTLGRLIKSSGYYNRKAEKLKLICEYLMEKCGGDLDRFAEVPTDTLREELLSIKGIGPETADSILLYAFDRPLFVVDRYTIRSLNRIGLINENAKYDDVQQLFMKNLPHETKLFNDFHAQLVALGKHFCKPKPQCEFCPLGDICRSKVVELC